MRSSLTFDFKFDNIESLRLYCVCIHSNRYLRKRGFYKKHNGDLM